MYNLRDNQCVGWMDDADLMYLYALGCRYQTILELGSWQGRSTHALLSGGAKVTAVDTWLGTPGEDTFLPKLDIHEIFCHNVGHFPNLTIFRGSGMDAVLTFPDKHFDVVFIDANHNYPDVKADIAAWLPKAKHVLCGHDYNNGHIGVRRAVDEAFGRPTGVVDAIWWVDIA